VTTISPPTTFPYSGNQLAKLGDLAISPDGSFALLVESSIGNSVSVSTTSNHRRRVMRMSIPSDPNGQGVVTQKITKGCKTYGLPPECYTGGNNGQVYTPHDIAFAPSGKNAYLTDADFNSIRKISASTNWAVLSAVAGSDGATYHDGSGAYAPQDGQGRLAKFKSPRGCFMLDDGTLLVADYHSNALRRVFVDRYEVSTVVYGCYETSPNVAWPGNCPNGGNSFTVDDFALPKPHDVACVPDGSTCFVSVRGSDRWKIKRVETTITDGYGHDDGCESEGVPNFTGAQDDVSRYTCSDQASCEGQVAKVRCCFENSDDNLQCTSHSGAGSATLSEAIAFCAQWGKRLCTEFERDAACCGTGAGYDGQKIWLKVRTYTVASISTLVDADPCGWVIPTDGNGDGSFPKAQLCGDATLALTKNGKTLFATNLASDTGYIRKIDTATGYVTTLTGGPRGNDDTVDGSLEFAQFHSTYGIALMPDDSALLVTQDGWSGDKHIAVRRVPTIEACPPPPSPPSPSPPPPSPQSPRPWVPPPPATPPTCEGKACLLRAMSSALGRVKVQYADL